MSKSNTSPIVGVQTDSYKYDVINYICRAQGFHEGHERTIREALEKGRTVLVHLGSAFKAPDVRNPLSFEQRALVIKETFKNNPRLIVLPTRDYPYNDTMWATSIRRVVRGYLNLNGIAVKNARIGLIGHRKEDTNYYIDMFQEWEFIEVGQTIDVCASDLRKVLFDPDMDPSQKQLFLLQYMSPVAVNHMMAFAYKQDAQSIAYGHTDEMLRLMREASFLKKHAERWSKSPYAPTFITVDAVVIQSGHVLLIKRRSAPGEGLWAIPGGYLDPGERINDAYIRELVEETRIKQSAATLRACVVDSEVFDYPGRSLRGRIVTHAFCIKLRNGPLTKVKAASDAKRAEWVPLDKFESMESEMFEDHFHIINHFISKLKDVK